MSLKSLPRQNFDLAILLGLLVGLVVFFHVAMALHGNGRYRKQHLGTALHYAATRIDLQHTIIVGFNATDTPTIEEFPVWQMVAGMFFKCFGQWWGWANIVSLILFLNCLYPLFQITQRFYGTRAAWWALVFFMSQALIFIYAGQGGTDGFCLSVSIWFWFACVQLLDDPIKWLFPAIVLGALTAVSKLPFFMAVGLASVLLLLQTRGFKWRDILILAAVGIMSGIVFFSWTHYTDALQKNAEFPLADLRLGYNPDMITWWFGDWHYRLNPANWVKAAWRFANVGFGNFSLMALFFIALASRRIHPAAKFSLAGAVLTTFVFTHVILYHYNYLMMFSPAAAILCAAALAQIEGFLLSHRISPRAMSLTAASIILASLFQGLMMMHAFSFDHFPIALAAAIREHTDAQDKLIVFNGDRWEADELIRTGRKGLSMGAWNTGVFKQPASYARLKQLGFNRLVITSESPFQNAIQIVNPGESDLPRVMAKSFLTSQFEAWPTIYASDDVIIKAIP